MKIPNVIKSASMWLWLAGLGIAIGIPLIAHLFGIGALVNPFALTLGALIGVAIGVVNISKKERGLYLLITGFFTLAGLASFAANLSETVPFMGTGILLEIVVNGMIVLCSLAFAVVGIMTLNDLAK